MSHMLKLLPVWNAVNFLKPVDQDVQNSLHVYHFCLHTALFHTMIIMDKISETVSQLQF